MAEPSFDIAAFKGLIERIKVAPRHDKHAIIQQLLSFPGLLRHYRHRKTKRGVLADCEIFDYAHELHTAKKLTAADYDVILVPKGYFKAGDKKFDVFLCRGHVFLEADLKSIVSQNPDTIGNRIKEGSAQCSRLVLDITSPIKKNVLIDGLRLGCQRNEQLIEVMLFYRSKFYRLFKTEILHNRIYQTIQ